MAKRIEAMSVVIARALYEEPNAEGKATSRCFDRLSEKRREPWLDDARRVMAAMASLAEDFRDYAYECSGADWLADKPNELWTNWLADCLAKDGPSPHCLSEDSEMCAGCDCWKATRANCA
jgi:hypothetical protein